MSKRITILMTMIFIFIFAGLAQTKKEGTKTETMKYEVASIKVESAVCNTCAGTIEKALKKVSGVKSAKVDIENKIASVKYIAAKTDLKQLETAISNAGYDANDTKRNPEAYKKLDACCKIDGDK